jgi:outer membrane assembly lipoprotein YfgL
MTSAVFWGLAGCASDRPKPVALEPIQTKLALQTAWQSRLDSVEFPLAMGARDDQFALASTQGKVSVLRATSGQTVWTVELGASLQAGVGFNGRKAAVVTRDNDLVVAEQGRVLWRHRLPAKGTTAPVVAGGRVFVMTVNRVVHAFDGESGQKLWTLDKPGDALTLAQSGVVSTFENTLLVGQGPRLTAVDPDNGSVRWEVAIANPRGANEVERLADLVGPPSRFADVVCARAFQSAVGCVNAKRGQLLWSRNSGGWQRVAGNDNVLVGADASDRITGWKTQSGEALWTQEKLLYRKLSGVTLWAGAAVVGDADGWVHFLNPQTGDILARMETDGSAIETPPVGMGDVLLAVTRKGGLFAFRAR